MRSEEKKLEMRLEERKLDEVEITNLTNLVTKRKRLSIGSTMKHLSLKVPKSWEEWYERIIASARSSLRKGRKARDELSALSVSEPINKSTHHNVIVLLLRLSSSRYIFRMNIPKGTFSVRTCFVSLNSFDFSDFCIKPDQSIQFLFLRPLLKIVIDYTS